MTIEQLQYILEIARFGSINKAALHLNMSQPNLSIAVKNLEVELGYTILERSKKGVTFTQNGSRMLNYAKNIFNEIQNIENLQVETEIAPIEFSVSAHYVSYGLYCFTELYKKYEAFPVRFQYFQKSFFDVINDVHNGIVSLGILNYPRNKMSLVKDILYENQLEELYFFDILPYLAVTQSHPFYHEKELPFDKIIDYPFILLDMMEKNFLGLDLLEKIKYFENKKNILTKDIFSLYYFMEHLHGITIACQFQDKNINSISSTINFPMKLFPIPDANPLCFSCITLKNKPKSPIMMDFIEIIKESF